MLEKKLQEEIAKVQNYSAQNEAMVSKLAQIENNETDLRQQTAELAQKLIEEKNAAHLLEMQLIDT